MEAVEFDTRYHQLADTESAATWTRMDSFIAAAHGAGLHVILNLSEFGQSLQAAGYTMGSNAWQTQWDQYLSFIAGRVNAITGVTYRNDPTILMIEMWGETPAPGYPNPVGTTAQVTAFFHNSLSTWHQAAPNILASTGGFSYLNSAQSGIDWRTIMSDPLDAVCGLEINSYDDRNTTLGMVTRYCGSIGKPWFLAAWSSCSKSSAGTWDINDWLRSTGAATDTAMAAHIADMYALAHGAAPAMYPALGSDFWNLGSQTSATCDLNPASPGTPSRSWAAVQAG